MEPSCFSMEHGTSTRKLTTEEHAMWPRRNFEDTSPIFLKSPLTLSNLLTQTSVSQSRRLPNKEDKVALHFLVIYLLYHNNTRQALPPSVRACGNVFNDGIDSAYGGCNLLRAAASCNACFGLHKFVLVA
eukprot:scaffold7531_cov185-Skeletonema_marinoi.AAC.3